MLWIAPAKKTASASLEKRLWDAASQCRANSGLKAQAATCSLKPRRPRPDRAAVGTFRKCSVAISAARRSRSSWFFYSMDSLFVTRTTTSETKLA